MQIAAMTFRLHAPWVHSLNEKRMVVRSLVAKIQNRFHASVAEIDEQDTHQIIVIQMLRRSTHRAVTSSTAPYPTRALRPMIPQTKP